MHSFALNLGLVLAAEKSKTPFYIAGGILVAWALFVSMGLGRKPDFPSSEGQQRGIMAVSAILVLAAVSMAVVTSGGSKSAKAATATSATTETTASETPATGTAGATTSATTGTPAPASSPAAASTVSLEANKEGQLSYNTKSLSAKAGKVTIEMANMSPVEHNVTIAQGSKVLGATPTFTGGKKSVTVNLAPGTYTFYCSVPGHRQAGMEGTLTVSS